MIVRIEYLPSPLAPDKEIAVAFLGIKKACCDKTKESMLFSAAKEGFGLEQDIRTIKKIEIVEAMKMMAVCIEYYPDKFDLDEYVVKTIRDIQSIEIARLGEDWEIVIHKDTGVTFRYAMHRTKKLTVFDDEVGIRKWHS